MKEIKAMIRPEKFEEVYSNLRSNIAVLTRRLTSEQVKMAEQFYN